MGSAAGLLRREHAPGAGLEVGDPFGDDRQKRQRAPVFDIEPFRFQRFISDLAGVDVTPHGGEPRRMAERTRNRLLTVSKRRSIPPTNLLLASYDRFADGLPAIAANAHLDVSTVIHRELERPPPAWVERERSAGGPG